MENKVFRLSESSLVAIMLTLVKGIKEGIDISQMLRDFRFSVDSDKIEIIEEE